MFVIPCKHYQHSNIINLILQIQQYHDNPEILVVDSNSSDKSYLNELEKMGVVVANIDNVNYHIGAYWFAYNNFKRDYYYMLHDSIEIHDNINWMKNYPFYCLAHAHRTLGPYQKECEDFLSHTKYKYHTNGHLIFGNIMMVEKAVMDLLKENHIDRILPSTKEEACQMERLYGFVLENEGYNIVDNSLYGDFNNLIYKNKQIVKNYIGRQ